MGELKERKRVNFVLSKTLLERLREYSEISEVPMSRIVEKAISDRLDTLELQVKYQDAGVPVTYIAPSQDTSNCVRVPTVSVAKEKDGQ